MIYIAIAVGQFILFSFMSDIGMMSFLAAILWLLVLLLAAEKTPHGRAIFIFGAIALFIRGVWIIFVQTPPSSDYSLMYNTAREILEGGKAYLNNIYYQRFPYQIGFTAYQTLVLWLYDSVSLLKLTHVGWTVVASVAVYGIARETFGPEVARLAMLLHVTLLPILILSSVMTNQHIAVACLYIGIYVWLKWGKDSWWAPVVAGAAVAVGTIMRPIGIVVIAAIVVGELISCLQRRTKDQYIGSARRIISSVVAYQLVLFLAGTLFSQTGLSPDGLANNDPLWKLVAGLNASTYGSYSTADERLLNYGYLEPEKRTELEKEIITERLTSPGNLVRLPFVKIGKLWADYQPTWFTFPGKPGTHFNYLGWSISFDDAIERYRHFERGVLYILSLLAFWQVWKRLSREFTDERKRFLILILGAYTCVHLLVEVQSRYLYFLFFIIVTFAAAGMLEARSWWRSRKRQ